MSVDWREGDGFASLVGCCQWPRGIRYVVMMGLGQIDIGVVSLDLGTSNT